MSTTKINKIYFMWYCLCDPANYRLADSKSAGSGIPGYQYKSCVFSITNGLALSCPHWVSYILIR